MYPIPHPRKILSTLFTAALLAATPALAQSDTEQLLNQGTAAYEHGDYASAFKLMSQLARQGDAPAQYNLGLMYTKGQGVAQDYRQARYWYEKAANRSLARAQNNLGSLYADERGGMQDYRQARSWWEKAAKQGFAPAQFNLGLLYYQGKGGAQDYQQARSWWEKAANQGDVDARQLALKGLELLKQTGH